MARASSRGLAIGVKYPALVLVGLLTMAVLCFARLSIRPGGSRPCGRSAVAALAAGFLANGRAGGGAGISGPTSHGQSGVSVLPERFGGAGLDEVLGPIKRPLAVTPWNLLTALVPLSLQPDRFDSFSHQFGPVFLLFLPALLLERRPARVLGLAALGYLFLTLCLTQRQSMRFVLIALGPMSVAVAYLATRWCERGTRPARRLVLVLAAGARPRSRACR